MSWSPELAAGDGFAGYSLDSKLFAIAVPDEERQRVRDQASPRVALFGVLARERYLCPQDKRAVVCHFAHASGVIIWFGATNA